MKLLIYLLFTFLLCFSATGQKDISYKIVIYPSHEKNHAMYDSSKTSFGSTMQKYINEHMEKDFARHSVLKKEMTLIVYQKMDSVSGTYSDEFYEFCVVSPKRGNFVNGFSFGARHFKQVTSHDSRSFLETKGFYSLSQEYELKREDVKPGAYFFVDNLDFTQKLDFQTIKSYPAQSSRIRSYSSAQLQHLQKWQPHVLNDVKANALNRTLKIRLLRFTKANLLSNQDTIQLFQYYYKDSPRAALKTASGKDSMNNTIQNKKYVVTEGPAYLDLKADNLKEILVYETGVFDAAIQSWIYTPAAVSPVFKDAHSDSPIVHKEMWVAFSDLQGIHKSIRKSTLKWFEGIQTLRNGDIVFQFEPEVKGNNY